LKQSSSLFSIITIRIRACPVINTYNKTDFDCRRSMNIFKRKGKHNQIGNIEQREPSLNENNSQFKELLEGHNRRGHNIIKNNQNRENTEPAV